MSAIVRVERHRRRSPAAPSAELTETLILRGQEVVAVITQGDPLRYVLQFSAGELRSMRENLAPVLVRQPRVKETLDALIEYKEQQSQERAYRSGSRSEKLPRQEVVRPLGGHGVAGEP